MRIRLLLLTVFATAFWGNTALRAASYPVNNTTDLSLLQAKVKPGDTLVFANKIWTDVQVELNFNGTASQPVIVMPQTTGQVIFSGNSTFRIGGSYTIVMGMVFNNISSKTTLLQYRVDKKNLANYCQVTNSVFDNCNPPDRLSDNNWITLYGQNNRFDHNTILNKKNLGTTLTVELNDELNQNNHHQIDHNYFGPRLKGGSNGSEIIRIGNSTFSRTSSQTIVEDNYFDRCNGEVEIISVKSCDNILRRNTFFECEGGLVLRHGNRNTVDENYFIGNNKIHTGGIRVINAGHKVTNNVLYQLAGDRFRSAFTIMNGVPNSPINRYDQVKDVVIEGNVFIDCKNVEFCGGKDFERTAKPENVRFLNNTFFSSMAKTQFTVNDDISGIKFKNNISSKAFSPLPSTGFKLSAVTFSQKGNSWNVNGKSYQPFATIENTGASFYTKTPIAQPVSGKIIDVPVGSNTLYEKALLAKDGDTLVLAAGAHFVSKIVEVSKQLTIRGAGSGQARPVLQYTGEQGGYTFFSIENGGILSLQNLICNGLSENGVAENFVRTSTKAMIEQYSFFADGCDFLNITDGRKHAFKANKGSFADTIQFTNCLFQNMSGEAISIAAEKEDKGIYNAEHVVFNNCVFNKILVGAIDVYRGGNDESTTGFYFTMNHCTFNEVGNVELCSIVRLIGVQHSTIANCIFNNSGRSGRTVKYEDFGWTENSISYCNSYISGKVESFYNNVIGKNMLKLNPQFENIEQGDFRLKANSPLRRKANDGKDMGAVYVNGQLKL